MLFFVWHFPEATRGQSNPSSSLCKGLTPPWLTEAASHSRKIALMERSSSVQHEAAALRGRHVSLRDGTGPRPPDRGSGHWSSGNLRFTGVKGQEQG